MKKGFALVELLMVVGLISAPLIAVIVTPVILNVKQDARIEAAKNSAYGVIDAAKLYYIESLLDDTKYYNIDGTTNLINEISVSGTNPDSGEVYVNSKGQVAVALVYDDICYKKQFTETDLDISYNIKNCTIY